MRTRRQIREGECDAGRQVAGDEQVLLERIRPPVLSAHDEPSILFEGGQPVSLEAHAGWSCGVRVRVDVRLLVKPWIWKLVGVADIAQNGVRDGKPDLIWQNPVSGYLGLWYMDGVQTLLTIYLTPNTIGAGTNWRIVGVK
jgi:hypothetical protein